MHIKPDLPCENQITVSEQTTITRKGHQGVNRLTRPCQDRWKKHRTKYGYDLAGNRTSEQIDTGISQSGYNDMNELTNRNSSGGPMQFAGSLDKQGTVTVAGTAALMNHLTTNFVGYTSVTNGTNVVPITATDYGNHGRTNNYQLVVTNNGVAEAISYDLNGNETSVVTATATNTYQWDAKNRLVPS